MAEYGHRDGLSTAPFAEPTTRRGFLAAAGAGALAAALASTGELWAAAAGSPVGVDGSRVVRMTSHRVIEGYQVSRMRLGKMIDGCVMALADCSDVGDAWRKFIEPGAKVLLKFGRLPGWGLRTERAMVESLVDSLVGAGYDPANLMAADCPESRYVAGLAPTPTGWSTRTVLVGGRLEQVRRYLDDIDVIINVPTVSDHNLAGVSCAMMNMSLPLIRRPGRYYDHRLHEAIVSVCDSSATIRRPTLTLVNALRCLYDGGPTVNEDNVAYDNSVWASTDMVAIDRLAMQWIERRRRMQRLDSLVAAGRPATYVQLADDRGLGTADLRRIVAQTSVM